MPTVSSHHHNFRSLSPGTKCATHHLTNEQHRDPWSSGDTKSSSDDSQSHTERSSSLSCIACSSIYQLQPAFISLRFISVSVRYRCYMGSRSFWRLPSIIGIRNHGSLIAPSSSKWLKWPRLHMIRSNTGTDAVWRTSKLSWNPRKHKISDHRERLVEDRRRSISDFKWF